MLYKVNDNYITLNISDGHNDLKGNIKTRDFFKLIYL